MRAVMHLLLLLHTMKTIIFHRYISFVARVNFSISKKEVKKDAGWLALLGFVHYLPAIMLVRLQWIDFCSYAWIVILLFLFALKASNQYLFYKLCILILLVIDTDLSNRMRIYLFASPTAEAIFFLLQNGRD